MFFNIFFNKNDQQNSHKDGMKLSCILMSEETLLHADRIKTREKLFLSKSSLQQVISDTYRFELYHKITYIYSILNVIVLHLF